MKKVIITLCMIAGLFTFTSCTNETSQVISDSEVVEMTPTNSVTVKEIQEYNKNLPIAGTRAGGRGNHISSADARGAFEGSFWGHYAGLGACGIIGPAGYLLGLSSGALAGAIAYSAKAAGWIRGYTVPTNDNLYQQINGFCNQKFSINNDSLCINMTDDNMAALLDIPDDFIYLKKMGMLHNQYLQENVTNQGVSLLSYIDRPIDNPLELSAVDQIFQDETFSYNYVTATQTFDRYHSRNTFDYNRYVEENPIGSETAEEILSLYLQAMYSIPNNEESLTNLVNDYINIIETNDELSSVERAQLYAAFVVSIYSYQLWNE